MFFTRHSGEKLWEVQCDSPTFTVAWHPKRPLLAYACDDKEGKYESNREVGTVKLFGLPNDSWEAVLKGITWEGRKKTWAHACCSTQSPPAGGVSGHFPVIKYCFINVFAIKSDAFLLYCVMSELQLLLFIESWKAKNF